MAHVEAQGGLGRKDGKLTVGIWLGLSTGWATVAIDRPPAALGAPHAPYTSYPVHSVGKAKGLMLTAPALVLGGELRGSRNRYAPQMLKTEHQSC